MKLLQLFMLFLIPGYHYAQVVQWANCGGGSQFDGSYSVTADAMGNSYVTGRYMGAGTFSGIPLGTFGLQDGYIAKYDPSGNLVWINHIGGTSMDLASVICLDNNGDLIVAGQFVGTGTFGSYTLTSIAGSYDCFLAKYDVFGNCIWVLKGGSSASYDHIKSIAVDAANNIFVSGWLTGNAIFGSYTAPVVSTAISFVAKINPAGVVQWGTTLCDHSAGSSMPLYGNTIALDGAGNIFVAGNFSGTCFFGPTPVTASGLQDIYFQRLNSSGNIIWTNIISGIYDDAAFGINTDPAGNVILAGYYRGTVSFGSITKTSAGNSQDIFVASYSNNGAAKWVQSFGGTTSDNSGCLYSRPNGDILLCGSFTTTALVGTYSLTSAGGTDAFVTCLNPSGVPKWAMSFGGSGTDNAYGIGANATGDIFCSGLFNVAANFNGINLNSYGAGDAFLVKIYYSDPLPVSLLSFTVSPDQDGTAIASWVTASEVNNNYFSLEKSSDGVNFNLLDHINGMGNSSTRHSYHFTDENPFDGLSYYRLSQTDFNGITEKLKTVSVIMDNSSEFFFNCYSSSQPGTFVIESSFAMSQIMVTDQQGRLVKKNDLAGNTTSVFLDLSFFQKGLYLIQVFSQTNTCSKKVIVY